MQTGTLAFLLGILALIQFPFLPAGDLVLLLPVCILLALVIPPLRITLLFAAGLLWALANAGASLQYQLPPDLEGQTLMLTGVVDGLTESDRRSVRFNFRVNSLESTYPEGQLEPGTGPQRVRLSWYGERPELAPGEGWQLQVRLRRPRGFMNPGGFDYEGWLFQQGLHATGYVRESEQNSRLQPAGHHVNALRDGIRQYIRNLLGETRAGALIAALAVGDRSSLGPDDWRVLRVSGTSHLLAISGLHIGLIAGLVFFPLRAIWGLVPAATRLLPAQHAAAGCALLFAAAYAALAGFTLPTQRALLMLTVATVAVLSRRQFRTGDILALALLAVLLIDPFAVLAAGFWLSFAAVAVILWGMGSRLPEQGLWWRYGRVQVIVAVGLLPLLLFWFQEYPLLGALANLFAVPWVGMLIMPLILAGFLLLPLWTAAGELLLFMAGQGLDILWAALQFLADQEFAAFSRPAPGMVAMLAGAAGAALLLLPRAVPYRWLGWLWLAPLIWPVADRPEPGDLRFTLLDVGQGLAAVIETREHVLVYDTGPRFSERFDAGSAAVMPYLHRRAHRRIDTLIISHPDNDHIGGAPALLAALPVDRILVIDPDVPELHGHAAESCQYGQEWTWDGIRFSILHPHAGFSGSTNDASCVLRVESGNHVLLLPGDIERHSEYRLVDRLGSEQLAADILVAPHHGSRTSSTPAFLNAVAPGYALFATGYRNRYGFPNSDIIERYRVRDIHMLNTASTGAVEFDLTRAGIDIRKTRRAQRRFWHQPDTDINHE
jgi:competence protein ComEC